MKTIKKMVVKGLWLACGWLVAAGLCGTAWAAPAPESDFGFDPSTGTITSYRGAGGDVEIPATIDGMTVTAIGDYVFDVCSSLTSVTIPAGVTDIRTSAFRNCHVLASVTFAEEGCLLENISNNAFNGTGLTSITIPAGVTNIGDLAFSSCGNLASVTFADGSQLKTMGLRVFKNCTALTSITIPAGVTSVGEQTFHGCSSLASITFAPGSQLKEFEIMMFYDCTALTEITIPAGVTNIGQGVFSKCASLTNIIFAPESQLTGIENSVFEGCPFSNISLPEGLTDIGQTAFYGCTNLTDVTIPAGVTNIGMGAFAMCSKLEEVTVLATEPPVAGALLFTADGTETPIASLKAIKVPAESVDKYKDSTTGSGWSTYAALITDGSAPAPAKIGRLNFTLKADGQTYAGIVTMADGETLGEDEIWVWARLGHYTSAATKAAWATLNAWLGQPVGTANLSQVTNGLDSTSFGTFASSPCDINRDIEASTMIFARAATADGTIRAIGGVMNVGKLESDETHENEMAGADPVSVAYYAWDSGTKKLVLQEPVQAIQVTDETTTLEDGKWYLVKSEWQYHQKITVTNSAHLILWPRADIDFLGFELAENATLSVYSMWNSELPPLEKELGQVNLHEIQVGAGATLNVHGGAVMSDALCCDTVNVYGGLLDPKSSDNTSPAMRIGTALNVHGGKVVAKCLSASAFAGIASASADKTAAVNVYGGVLNAQGGEGAEGVLGIDVGTGEFQVSLTVGAGMHVWVSDATEGTKTEVGDYAASRARCVWVTTSTDLVQAQDFVVTRNGSTFSVKMPSGPGEGCCWGVITLHQPYSTQAGSMLMNMCSARLQQRYLLSGDGDATIWLLTYLLEGYGLPYQIEYHSGDTFDLDDTAADAMVVCRVADDAMHCLYSMGGAIGLQGMTEGTSKENQVEDGGVEYYAWDDSAKQLVRRSCLSATPVTAEMTELGSGWYVVQGQVVIDRSGITDAELRKPGLAVNGDVHLILMDGAELVVTGAYRKAGIEVGVVESVTNSLTIYGQAGQTGKLTAVGGEEASGIGGNHEQSCGTVTINGGVVAATSGKYAACIGGGAEGDGGTVTINAGTVTANGGSKCVGIGGGGDEKHKLDVGGVVVINGGVVTASGGTACPGIGGGMCGGVGTVTINGGEVTASAGQMAAGIGGGTDGDAWTVTINGGHVTATGYGGAGVGAGPATGVGDGNGGDVTVNGGEVTAISLPFDVGIVVQSDGIGGGVKYIETGRGDPGTFTQGSGLQVLAGMNVDGSDAVQVHAGDFASVWHTNAYVKIMAAPAKIGRLNFTLKVVGNYYTGIVTMPESETLGDDEIWAWAYLGSASGEGAKSVWATLNAALGQPVGTINLSQVTNGLDSTSFGTFTTSPCDINTHISDFSTFVFARAAKTDGTIRAIGGVNDTGECEVEFFANDMLGEGLVSTTYYVWDSGEKKLVLRGPVEAIQVTSETTALEGGQWYIISGEHTFNKAITVSGSAHLICWPNSHVTFTDTTFAKDATLSVYSTLDPTDPSSAKLFERVTFAPSQGGDGATLNIHGGDVGMHALQCDTVNVYGGFLESRGFDGLPAMRIDSALNVHGGRVLADSGGQDGRAGIVGGDNANGAAVRVYGGDVEAVGGWGAPGIDVGTGASQVSLTIEEGLHTWVAETTSSPKTEVSDYSKSRDQFVWITSADLIRAQAFTVTRQESNFLVTMPDEPGEGYRWVVVTMTKDYARYPMGETLAADYLMEYGTQTLEERNRLAGTMKFSDLTDTIDIYRLPYGVEYHTGETFELAGTVDAMLVCRVTDDDWSYIHTMGGITHLLDLEVTESKPGEIVMEPDEPDYEFDPETGTITRYIGAGGDVTIPAAIGGVTVENIGGTAFAYIETLTSVVIPEGVTNIGDMAFVSCMSLTNAVIPETVTEIGGVAFGDCASLTGVVLPPNLKSINASVFASCDSLTNIVIPASVTNIGEMAFQKSGLESIIFADGSQLETIGEQAFMKCASLTGVVLPPNLKSVSFGMFASCESLTNITIPASVTNIGARAFWASGLESITFADGSQLETIGPQAFLNCNLTDIVIPASVKNIDAEAFVECMSLTSVVIPASVTNIGDIAFGMCIMLKTVSIAATEPPTIGEMVFGDCEALEKIHVPAGTAAAYKEADGWREYADLITDGTVETTYYAWDGEKINGPLTTNAIPVTADMTELNSGWYVVNSVVSNFTGITVKGDAHLILADGAELYANGAGVDFQDETDAAGICVNVVEGGTTNSISIYGQENNTGKLIAIGGSYGAGIGSQCPLAYRAMNNVTAPVDCGVITIHGGDISASSMKGAGIGGFCFEGISGVYGGTITIYGGKVEAMGAGGGTGIGSGGYTDHDVFGDEPSCRVTIYGGEITAIGEEAGIGGGMARNSGIVTIYDGTVNAVSENLGAGIGSGEMGTGGDIAIYGGNIQAHALFGAGIGCGAQGAGGMVTIHGGTVRAWSLAGAGIGGGAVASGCAVTISGGEVTAVSYSYDMGGMILQSDGIGAGYNMIDPTTSLDPGTLDLSGYTGTHYIYAGMDTNGVEVTEVAADDFATVWHTNCYVQITQTKRQDPALEDYVFDSETGTILKYKGAGGDVTIPAAISGVAVENIGDTAFANIETLTSVVIPEGVTNIGDSAFMVCEALTNAVIPETVTEIGAMAFGSCVKLTGVVLPPNLKSVNGGMFASCESLTNITIPASVTNIGETAFWKSGLESIIFADGSQLETIGQGAFMLCESLTDIVIPASVKDIGNVAFAGCVTLKTVSIAAAEPPTAGEDMFGDCYVLEKIYVLRGKKAAYVANEGWAEYADLIVEVPNYLAFTARGGTIDVMLLSGYGDAIAVEWASAENPFAWSDFEMGRRVTVPIPADKTIYIRHKGLDTIETFSESGFAFVSETEEARVEASGNVMSLLDQTCQKTSVGARAFIRLFYVEESQGDESRLTSAPELPATTLAGQCYAEMFDGCTLLTNAPALPATTLAARCYSDMFRGCTALTDAPELAATTLTERCYYGMFVGCTSLTNVPRLAAREFNNESAKGMFQGAKKLDALTVEFDVWSQATAATKSWLYDVAETGVFTCPIELPVIKDASHIPVGWVVRKRFTLPGPTAAGSYVVTNALGQVVEPIESVPGGNLYEVPVAGADDTISIYVKPAAGYVVHGQNPLMINLTEGGEMGELPVAELPATVTIVSAKSARTEGAWSGAAQVVYELHNLHEGRNYALEFDLTAAGQFGSCTTNLPSAVVDGVYTQDVNRVEFFGPESQVEDPAAELTLKLIEK